MACGRGMLSTPRATMLLPSSTHGPPAAKVDQVMDQVLPLQNAQFHFSRFSCRSMPLSSLDSKRSWCPPESMKPVFCMCSMADDGADWSNSGSDSSLQRNEEAPKKAAGKEKRQKRRVFDRGPSRLTASSNCQYSVYRYYRYLENQYKRRMSRSMTQLISSRLVRMEINDCVKVDCGHGNLKRYGIAGMLSYGLLNTFYYLGTFLFVWLYVAPSKGGLGFVPSAQRFLKVFAMVWAGSQVTKLIRAAGALTLAPIVDRGLNWFTARFNFHSKGKAFGFIVVACFVLAVLVFLTVTTLWA